MAVIRVFQHIFIVLILAGHCLPQQLFANTADKESPLAILPIVDLKPIQDLSSGWIDDEHRFQRAPFWRASTEQWELSRFFSASDTKDTVWVYFEKLAWETEVWLNGSLLKLQKEPFQALLLPLPPGMLSDSSNVLTIRQEQNSLAKKFWPQSFCGSYGKIWLLGRSAERKPPVYSKWVSAAKEVAFLAPWSPETGPVADGAWFKTKLAEIKSRGISVIYFPFEPPALYLSQCNEEGFSRLDNLLAAGKVAFVNEYPQAWGRSGIPVPFWFTEDGSRSRNFGALVAGEILENGYLRKADRLALSVFLVLALLGLLLIKVLTPRLWVALPEFLTKSKIYLELIRNGKFLRQYEVILLTIYRTALLSLILALTIYYISLSGKWEWLNVFSSKSILFRLYFATEYTPVQIFFQVWAYVGAISLFKYILMSFCGQVFNIQGLGQSIQDLDIFASFPLLWLPLLPVTVLFFAPPTSSGIAAGFLLALILIYQLRLLGILYQGISSIFQFSAGIKILYICALEIVPWVIMI